jgi:AcrR family transcriptional regulator
MPGGEEISRRRSYRQPRDPEAGSGGADAVDAFLLARKTFLACERVEMKKLAAQLDVDRTTLFRWVGNRDELLGQVLCSAAEPTWTKALAGMRSEGAQGVAQVLGDYVLSLIESPSLRAFLRAEPERALRLLTTRAGVLQREVVGYVEALLKQEEDRGNLRHPLAVHDLAYLIIRIAESFIYTDLITGEEPDAEKARTAVAALLGVPVDQAKKRGPAKGGGKARRAPAKKS